MESITFKISDENPRSLKSRIYKRTLKKIVPIMIIIFVTLLYYMSSNFSGEDDLLLIWLPMFMSIPIVALALWFGLRMGIKNFLSQQLIVSKEGIEKIMQNGPFVRIPWDSLETDITNEGEIILIDNRVNKVVRWWNGKGKVVVPPELDNLDKLNEILREMKKRRTTT